MIAKLNARKVESLRPIPGKRTEYHDSEVKGLSLRISAQGAKSWSVLYRHRGRLRRLTLGSVDVISLADARERAGDELYKASKGGDPATEKQQEKKAETIAELVREYIEKHAKRKKRSWKEDDRILRNNVLPTWKHRAIADIRRRDVRQLLEPIAERAPVMANRTLACVRKMFSFAVDRELIEHNPAARTVRPGSEQSRSRVLTDDEIRAFWKACDDLPPAMAAYFRLRLVTLQRGKEVAALRSTHLDGQWWTIPAAVAKNKLDHRVWVSELAQTILKTLPATDGYLLAGARGRRQQTDAIAQLGLKDFRGHDLRRTASSRMASGGVPRLVISKVLNHVESGVTAVYDRHSYDAEKRVALDTWERTLTAILEAKRGTVVPFARG